MQVLHLDTLHLAFTLTDMTRKDAFFALIATIGVPALLSASAPAQAQSVAPAGSEPAVGLAACRALSDDMQRLACYDGLVEGLPETAIILPEPPPPKPDSPARVSTSKDDDEEQIAATITAVELYPSLEYALVTLDNGQVWRTTSIGSLFNRLRAGQKITITPGSFSGFRLRIDGITGFQGVRRTR